MNEGDLLHYMVGKEYCCRTAQGDIFSLIFESLSLCKDNNGNTAIIKFEAGALILLWNSGSFRKMSLRTTVGHTRVHGTCDGVVNYHGLQKDIMFNIKNDNNFNRSTYDRVAPPLSIVICAYNLTNKINDFITWNHPIFSKIKNLEVIIIIEPGTEINIYQPYLKIINYPKLQQLFSIGKTINFGIRQTSEGMNRIIIKSDIDIIFTRQVINFVMYNVISDMGIVALPAYIERNFNLNQLDDPSYWCRYKKNTEAKGACFALTKNDWFKLNGYDERIEGWGGDDTEIWLRSNKKLKNMKVTTLHPIYHIEHPIRIGQNNFLYNSDKNMQISTKLDWQNKKWGLP